MLPPTDPDVLMHDPKNGAVVGKVHCWNAHEPGHPNRWRGWHTCRIEGKDDRLSCEVHDTMQRASDPVREEHDKLCGRLTMTETKATHAAGAIRAAEIITGHQYGDPRGTFSILTAYGQKTVWGIADLIDRETKASETAAQRDRLFEALLLVEADLIEHQGTRLEGTVRHVVRRAVRAAIATTEAKP